MTTVKDSKVLENQEKLKHFFVSSPSATHVYFRRIGKDNLVIDVPIGQAEATIRQWPMWEIVSSNKQMDDEIEKLFLEDPEEPTDGYNVEEIVVPSKPSEIKKKRGRPRKNVTADNPKT